jgi:flagellar FliL protein
MAKQNEPAAEESTQGADQQSGYGRGFIAMLAVVALLAGAGGSVAAHLNYSWLASAVPGGSMLGGGESSPNAAQPGATEASMTDFGSFYEVDNMIINPAQSKGSRYLMVNVGFESDQETVLTELEEKEVVVRDRVIKMLGEFTVPELSDIDRRAFLKDTLLSSVNEVLKDGEVRRLYFTQYVLQ